MQYGIQKQHVFSMYFYKLFQEFKRKILSDRLIISVIQRMPVSTFEARQEIRLLENKNNGRSINSFLNQQAGICKKSTLNVFFQFFNLNRFVAFRCRFYRVERLLQKLTNQTNKINGIKQVCNFEKVGAFMCSVHPLYIYRETNFSAVHSKLSIT